MQEEKKEKNNVTENIGRFDCRQEKIMQAGTECTSVNVV